MPSSIRSVLALACLGMVFLSPLSAMAATGKTPVCVPAPGSSPAALARLESDMRADDDLMHRLLALQGEPARCSGRAAKPGAEDESWLEFAWPDHARLKQSWMPPETFIADYTNPRGLAHADAVVAAFREHANRIGMRVDWTAPHETLQKNTRVVEYRDPDANGFVRLRYDRQRLVAVWLSLAL